MELKKTTINPSWAGIIIIGSLLIIFIILFSYIPKIPQWKSYHLFADTRSLWGIPNFWNVVSNLPFFFVSIWGFRVLQQQRQNYCLDKKEEILFFILFLGVFLIGLGSAYYHWAPDNNRLVWDRIPMTVVFMSLLALTIMERINLTLGFWLWIPLLCFGIFSVLYWHWTELAGAGDMRLYGLVQFYSIFLILLVLLLFPKSYPALSLYVGMFVFYGLAKIAEHLDFAIYQFGEFISGHTLKHLLAALSIYFIIRMLQSHPQSRI